MSMEITLEDLKEAMIYFSSAQSEFLTENCIVALESIPHTTDCEINITGMYTGKAKLKWTKQFKKNGYREEKKYTEKGAEALSFITAVNLTEYDVVEESYIGSGIDYWLGYKADNPKFDPLNFMNARLEVSGILKENENNTFEKRIKIKKDQTKASDHMKIPAYVSVVEFSNLKLYFDKK